jgi:hypothetical protein
MCQHMVLLEHSRLLVSRPLGVCITNDMVVEKALGFAPHFAMSEIEEQNKAVVSLSLDEDPDSTR